MIQVDDSRVPGFPLRPAIGPRALKMSLPIIEVDELGVGLVVAEHHVEVAVSVQVSQVSRVGSISGIGQVVPRHEVALAISQQHPAPPRPVSTLDQDQVQVAVSIQVCDADIGRRVGAGIEQEYPVIMWDAPGQWRCGKMEDRRQEESYPKKSKSRCGNFHRRLPQKAGYSLARRSKMHH